MVLRLLFKLLISSRFFAFSAINQSINEGINKTNLIK